MFSLAMKDDMIDGILRIPLKQNCPRFHNLAGGIGLSIHMLGATGFLILLVLKRYHLNW